MEHQLINILLVEDNPGDARLVREIFSEANIRGQVSLVNDGLEALDYLHKTGKFRHAPQPGLVLLDIDLPKKNGLEVLDEIKSDRTLKRIPVVLLSASDSEADILKGYTLKANAYIIKPADQDQFIEVVRSLHEFWMEIACLPMEQSLN